MCSQLKYCAVPMFVGVDVNVRQRQPYAGTKFFDCVSELHTQAIEYAQELRPTEVQPMAIEYGASVASVRSI